MIEGINGEQAGMFGLFELDGNGTVLYSRPRTNGELARNSSDGSVGRDFFYEVAAFENREDLRRHFRKFVTSADPKDCFTFDCLFGGERIKTKIFMTRGHESAFDHTEGIVIMDIRQVSE